MWLHRNDAFHSNQRTQDTVQQLHQIDTKIQRQRSIGTQGLDDADKLHFKNRTLARILRKTRHYKQTWIQQVQLARQSKHVSEDSSTDTDTLASAS